MSSQTEFGKILILGQSGQGKTFLAKTADPNTTGFINCSRKPLPYKGNFLNHGKPKTWHSFIKNLRDYVEKEDIENIIVDDVTMAFDNLLQESQKNFKNYDIFSNFNKYIPDFLDLIRDAKKNIIVTGHDEILLIEGYKQKRAKIHGKQFEGTIERYFTTVLYASTKIKDNKPEYFLKTFEPDTSAKCSEDLFGSPNPLEIPNDAGYIFSSLQQYYV